MSICDTFPDEGSYDYCFAVNTFSVLGGQQHPVNEEAVVIAHNSSTSDAYFILSYLITNGETLKFWQMVESCWN